MMLGEEFIDRKLSAGSIIRVNIRRGSFSILGAGESSPDDSELHPVNHVVFLGERCI